MDQNTLPEPALLTLVTWIFGSCLDLFIIPLAFAAFYLPFFLKDMLDEMLEEVDQ